MSRRVQAIMKLGMVSRMGPSSTRRLFTNLQEDGVELEYLLEFNEADLVSAGFSEDQAAQFVNAEPGEEIEQLLDSGIQVVTTLDRHAPKRMLESRSSPWYFFLGPLDILQSQTIGFAGSRDASSDAIILTSEIAHTAVTEGWCVVSGGARGVDAAAVTTAADHGGEAVIVLPQGIATWRVPEELDLERTLILSEFAPFDDWGAYRAMQRNKSVVELSDILVIPQTGERGGTWNAGEYAIKRKKPVFVADLEGCCGNQKMIELGAAPLRWSGDMADLAQRPDAERDGAVSPLPLL